MFGRDNRRLLDLFKGRFESDGEGYLFRSRPTRPAVRVTRSEFQESVERYRRGSRWQSVVIAIALIPAVLSMVIIDGALKRKSADWEISVLTIGLITAFMFRWNRLWTAPSREFADRRKAGPPLTRFEARARALRQISWSQLGMSGFVVFVLAVSKTFDTHLALPWRITWGVFCAAVIIALGYRAAEKWTLSRRH